MKLHTPPTPRILTTRGARGLVLASVLALGTAACIGGGRLPLPPGGVGNPTTTASTVPPTTSAPAASSTTAPTSTTPSVPSTTATSTTATSTPTSTTPTTNPTTTAPATTAPPTTTTTIADDGQPHVFFLQPADGATVVSPVTVKLGALNFEVEAAGQARPGAGHLHVMIDTPCLAAGTEIPRDAVHVHLGNGQLEASLTLGAGPHRLCLQAGDGLHKALALSDELLLTVAG